MKAVVFDAVGTLMYPVPSVADVYKAAIHQHCQVVVPADRIRAAVRDALKARSDSCDLRTNEQAERQFWAELIRRFCSDDVGFQAAFDDLFAHFAAPHNWKCFSDTIGLVAQIHEKGCAVAIASNFDLRLHRVCEGLPELVEIEHRIISSVVGWRKPAPEFFHAVAAVLGIAPERILMVGDDLQNDILGATAAGMQTAWICRDATDRVRTAVPEQTFVMASLNELLPRLISQD